MPVAPTPLGETEVGTHVLFNVSKWTLDEAVAQPTEALAKAIREALAKPDTQSVEVQGHTDDSGEDDLNDQVSVKRAEALRDWLVRKGIPADRLVVKGYSWTRPVADNRIRQGRQANRRVQFVIVKRAK